MIPTPAVPPATPADPCGTSAAPVSDPTVSIHARLHPAVAQGAPRAFVQVWAGRDPEHRAHCGTLTMRSSDAAELIVRITAGEPGPEQITPEIAAHVLWYIGASGGYGPGHFVRNLLAALETADLINRTRLLAAYPGYVAAINLAEQPGGIAQLQAIAAQAGGR